MMNSTLRMNVSEINLDAKTVDTWSQMETVSDTGTVSQMDSVSQIIQVGTLTQVNTHLKACLLPGGGGV